MHRPRRFSAGPRFGPRQTQSGPSTWGCAYISCAALPCPMTDHLVSSTESSTDSSIESEPEPLLARTRDESDETRSSASSALAIRDAGEVCFVSAERRSQACLELEEVGLVVVRIEDIGPAARGRLGDALDTAVERALAECGALGPGIAPPESPDASLSDQL